MGTFWTFIEEFKVDMNKKDEGPVLDKNQDDKVTCWP